MDEQIFYKGETKEEEIYEAKLLNAPLQRTPLFNHPEIPTHMYKTNAKLCRIYLHNGDIIEKFIRSGAYMFDTKTFSGKKVLTNTEFKVYNLQSYFVDEGTLYVFYYKYYDPIVYFTTNNMEKTTHNFGEIIRHDENDPKYELMKNALSLDDGRLK